MTRKAVSIGHLARRTGVAVSAIRFYEARGLLTADRTASGHRQFTGADIRRVSFIRIAQDLGFSLAQIATQLVELPEGRTPTKADWTRLSRGFRADIDARITRLERLRDTLDGCIGCGCLSLKSCGLHNPDDQAKEAGPGPRYIIDGRAGE